MIGTKFYVTIFIFLVIPLFGYCQVELTDSPQDQRGGFYESISITSDGMTVAVGVPSSGKSKSGRVSFYTWKDDTWILVSESISGPRNVYGFGYEIAFSGDGTTIAVAYKEKDEEVGYRGRVNVYRQSSGGWVQLGKAMEGEGKGDAFGASMDISDDGTILVIGARHHSSSAALMGQAKVFRWNEGAWETLGTSIEGEEEGERCGNSVAISSDGYTLAVASWLNNSNGRNSGIVRVFKWQDRSWTQCGKSIIGEFAGQGAGSNIDLSSDGQIIAIGAHLSNNEYIYRNGSVRILRWTGKDWKQMGESIIGSGRTQALGKGVALSANGLQVVIGAPNYNSKGKLHVGQVRLFEFRDSVWVQIGEGIEGDYENARFGKDVAVSNNGRVAAIGDYQSKFLHDASHLPQAMVFDFNFIYYKPIVLLSSEGANCENSRPLERFSFGLYSGDELNTQYSIPRGQVIETYLDKGYTIKADPLDEYIIQPSGRELKFEDLKDKLDNNTLRDTFCLLPQSVSDLRTTIVPLYNPKNKDKAVFKIMLENLRASDIACQLEILYEGAQLKVEQSKPQAKITKAGEIKWDGLLLGPLEQQSFFIVIVASNTPQLPEQPIRLTAKAVSSFSDLHPVDNVFHHTYESKAVTSSSLVPVGGDSLIGASLEGELHYQINLFFPDSSNAETFKIENSLDKHMFDVSSVRFIDANIPVSLSVKDNTLEFVWESSNRKRKQRSAYIQYALKVRPDSSPMKTLIQEANIYFEGKNPLNVSASTLIKGKELEHKKVQ